MIEAAEPGVGSFGRPAEPEGVAVGCFPDSGQ